MQPSPPGERARIQLPEPRDSSGGEAENSPDGDGDHAEDGEIRLVDAIAVSQRA